MFKTLYVSLALSSLLSASINVYQDKAQLQYKPTNTFIGFNSSIKATDNNGALKIEKGNCSFDDSHYCSSIKEINDLQLKNQTMQKEKNTLLEILKKYEPKDSEATKVLAYVKALHDKSSALEKRIAHNNYLIQKNRKKNVLNTYTPHLFTSLPKSEVALSFNGISFTSHYSLNIDTKKLEQRLHVINRSGIDIKETDATFFDSRLVGIERNEKFRSKLIYINQPLIEKTSFRSQKVATTSADISYMAAAPIQIAQKESTRVYKINPFSLASNGIKKEYLVASEPVKIKTNLIWNAWQNRVYESAKVTLSSALENQKLDLTYKNKKIENVNIRKDGTHIYLNIAQEYDIEVSREKIPKFTQDRGLFNSDEETQSGFRLQVSNLAKKAKKLEIIEKIPLSTDKKIEVSLKNVWVVNKDKREKSTFSYDKKIGKLSLHVTLQPQETLMYEYEFSIKHPKEMHIRY